TFKISLQICEPPRVASPRLDFGPRHGGHRLIARSPVTRPVRVEQSHGSGDGSPLASVSIMSSGETLEQLLNVVADAGDKRLPEVARTCRMALGTQLRALKAQLLELDRMITAWHRSNEMSKRLDAIPGVGHVLATALVASIADPKVF